MGTKKGKNKGLSEKEREDAVESLTTLRDLFDERIVELYQQRKVWQGAMQARHCYIYYRSLVLKALVILG